MPNLGTSLSIGLTGLQSSQEAINVLGHNIANVNTPGYSRQQVTLNASPAVNWGNFRFGTGVSVSGVQALRDQFLNLQLTQSIANHSGAQTRYEGVQSVSSAFADDGTNGINSQLQQFFTSMQTLATNPESSALRQAVLGKGESLVNQLQATYQTLTDQISNSNQQVAAMVTDVNALTEQIASLNKKISMQVDPQSDHDAIDQRQELTDKLAKLVGIQVSSDSRNQYQISLDSGAATLVAGINSYKMTASHSGDLPSNNLKVEVHSGKAVINVTGKIKGGTLGANMDLRDNVLPGYQDQLNRIAGSITSQLNQQNEAGYVPPNTPGKPAVHGAALFTGNFDATGNPVYKDFVNNLAVNRKVESDSRLIATAGSPGSGAGDNENILAMADLQNTGEVDIKGDGSEMTGPYSTAVANLINQVGTDTQGFSTAATNHENLTTALQTQKNGVSAVNLDQEAAQLLSYQQGYQAAAQFISTITKLTDQLMNTMSQS